jgi:hypothetical protein
MDGDDLPTATLMRPPPCADHVDCVCSAPTRVLTGGRMSQACALCGKAALLKLGHIVPRFVTDWLKSTTPGMIRNLHESGKRIQDGPKLYLLCGDCELLFSAWEKTFAERVFRHFHRSSDDEPPVPYESWCLNFATSVSWRSLRYLMHRGLLADVAASQHPLLDAEETWRDFLLDRRSDVGQFEQHILPLAMIADHTTPGLSPYINRYLLRVFHIDILTSPTSALIYTKLCHLALFGFIRMPDGHPWSGTRLSADSGMVGSRQYTIPHQMLTYWNEQANLVGGMYRHLSPRQNEKLREVRRRNPQAVADSEAFRALVRDFEISGRSALVLPPEDDDSNIVI